MFAFWKTKRVLITGLNGFKGTWLGLILSKLGANVRGLSLKPVNGSLFQRVSNEIAMDSRYCDIRSLVCLEEELRQFQPEVIFHLAAQPLVNASFAQPVETFQTNVVGVFNVLQASLYCDSLEVLINVTTDKVYQNQGSPFLYREEDEKGGNDLYSSTKACSELLTSCFSKSFFKDNTAIATCRAGNVIGGGDWASDRLVPDLIRSFENGTPLLLRNADATRPWLHVLDVLFGYLAVAEHCATDNVNHSSWNFGPASLDQLSVRALVAKFESNLNARFTLVNDEKRFQEENFLALDSTKARTVLGWKDILDPDFAVAYTADWYKKVCDGSSAYETCDQQINQYLDLYKISQAERLKANATKK